MQLLELHNKVTIYLKEKTDYIKHLLDSKFIIKLTYLVDIFLAVGPTSHSLDLDTLMRLGPHGKIMTFKSEHETHKK